MSMSPMDDVREFAARWVKEKRKHSGRIPERLRDELLLFSRNLAATLTADSANSILSSSAGQDATIGENPDGLLSLRDIGRLYEAVLLLRTVILGKVGADDTKEELEEEIEEWSETAEDVIGYASKPRR